MEGQLSVLKTMMTALSHLHRDTTEKKIGNMGEECKILDEQCEKGSYSAKESVCKEPTTHGDMLKRPEEERKKWKEGCMESLQQTQTSSEPLTMHFKHEWTS